MENFGAIAIWLGSTILLWIVGATASRQLHRIPLTFLVVCASIMAGVFSKKHAVFIAHNKSDYYGWFAIAFVCAIAIDIWMNTKRR
jgi:hypothetical protein